MFVDGCGSLVFVDGGGSVAELGGVGGGVGALVSDLNTPPVRVGGSGGGGVVPSVSVAVVAAVSSEIGFPN